MKKMIAFLLIAVLAISLTGCFGGGSSKKETSTEPIEEYAKENFLGLQKLIVDYYGVEGVDLSKFDPASTNEPADTASVRAAVYYDLIGAETGVRINISNSAFIDLYDFTNADNDTAKAFLAKVNEAVKNDEKIEIEGSPYKVSCAVSGTGNIVMLFKGKSDDYKDIIDALKKNW